MVAELVTVREETTGFGEWDGADYVSGSPKRHRVRRRADMPQKNFPVSNETKSLADFHTGSFWQNLGEEEVFHGLAENVSEGDAVSDLQDTVKAAEKQPIAPKSVRSYRRNKKLAEALDRLSKFAGSLGTVEAPMHINLAKKALADSWQSIAEEDSEIRIAIASLEGALRQKKWQDYSSEQVNIISGILSDCIEGRLNDLKSVLGQLSVLHKRDIDIYPSASEEDYAEAEEEI